MDLAKVDTRDQNVILSVKSEPLMKRVLWQQRGRGAGPRGPHSQGPHVLSCLGRAVQVASAAHLCEWVQGLPAHFLGRLEGPICGCEVALF